MTLSLILPFFHKSLWFEAAFPLTDCYRAPDTEVVCVLDAPNDEWRVMRLVKANPNVKFKVLVNDVPHPWRPPCIPLNVGIRHASGDYVALFSPESIIRLPTHDYLVWWQSQNITGGLLWHDVPIEPSDPVSVNALSIATCLHHHPFFWFGYGFLMCPKAALEEICGYDESRTGYGGDDNDLRARLLDTGRKMVIDPEIKIFHPKHSSLAKRSWPNAPLAKTDVKAKQGETWGKTKFRVAHDWTKQ